MIFLFKQIFEFITDLHNGMEMVMREITVGFSEKEYKKIEHAAHQIQRSVENYVIGLVLLDLELRYS